MMPNTRAIRLRRLRLRAKARRLLQTARALSRVDASAATHPGRQRLSASSSLLAARPHPIEAEVNFSDGGTAVTADTLRAQLHQAVREGHTQVVEDILRREQPGTAAAVSSVNESGDDCIHVAAKLGYAEIVSLLVHHGAEKNGLGSRSRTPLHLACIYGHLQAVDVLLGAGADVSIVLRDASGYEHWALSFSARMGHVDVLKSLLRHGADVRQAGARGLTALHYAAVRNQAGTVRALVEAGADIEAAVDDDGGGGTPLHASSVMRCYDAALALLRCGANVDSVNAFGYSPLHGAARQGGKEGSVRMVDLLLRWGADETAIDRDGNRPIDVVGNSSRVEEDSGRQKDEIDSLRELLENAPADRAWRRRGFLVLCRVYLQQRFHGLHQQQRLSAEEVVALKRDSLCNGLPARRGSKTGDPENKMWSELARTELAPQTPKTLSGSSTSGGGGTLSPCETAKPAEQKLGRSEARGDVRIPGNGDDFGSALVRLIDFPEEGVFRNAVSFL